MDKAPEFMWSGPNGEQRGPFNEHAASVLVPGYTKVEAEASTRAKGKKVAKGATDDRSGRASATADSDVG